MKSLSVDRSYTGELILCVKLMQDRNEFISQTNIEPVYYYHIGTPEHNDNIRCCDRHDRDACTQQH